ncbi:hypothetical protein GNI_190490, partial [Gregarina niphandrodes]
GTSRTLESARRRRRPYNIPPRDPHRLHTRVGAPRAFPTPGHPTGSRAPTRPSSRTHPTTSPAIHALSCVRPSCVNPSCVSPSCVSPSCVSTTRPPRGGRAAPCASRPPTSTGAETPPPTLPSCASPSCVSPSCVSPSCVSPSCVSPSCVSPSCVSS